MMIFLFKFIGEFSFVGILGLIEFYCSFYVEIDMGVFLFILLYIEITL